MVNSNYKYKVIIGIAIVEDAKSLIVDKPAEITVDGQKGEFPLAVLRANREDMHKFVDTFFNQVEKEDAPF